jgi:hypothetical protein
LDERIGPTCPRSCDTKVLIDTFVQYIWSLTLWLNRSDMITESTERTRRRMTQLGPLAGLSLAAPVLLVGCSHAPEYSIFGSFFPAWIFSAAGGLLLATGARALIARSAMAEHLAAPILFYLSMATFLSCILWLLFYS